MSALDQGRRSRGDVSGVRVRVETEEQVEDTWPRILHSREAAREAASQERAGSGSGGQTSTLGSRESCVAVSGRGCGPPAAETQHLRQECWLHKKGDVGNVMTFSFPPPLNSQPTQTQLIQRESSEGTRISFMGVVWPE